MNSEMIFPELEKIKVCLEVNLHSTLNKLFYFTFVKSDCMIVFEVESFNHANVNNVAMKSKQR